MAGLRVTPQRSESSSTGYKSVYCGVSKPKPSQAQVRRGGTDVTLSSFAYGFATPEEAALCYARSPEAQAAAAAPTEPPPTHAPTTAEEALRQAEVDRLRLLESASSSGYNGVSFSSGKAKPSSLADAEAAAVHRAQVSRGGTQVYLDTFFATAEEAALCYARSPEVQGATAAPIEPPPLTAEEALRQADAEGLTLPKSESSNTGYLNVCFISRLASKPYQTQVRRGGKQVRFGRFATAEEAALSYARTSEAQATAPQPPPASSRKRKVTLEEQPPDVVDVPTDVVVILEGRFVESTTLE